MASARASPTDPDSVLPRAVNRAVNTAQVTRPRTGFGYLDAVLEQPAAVLAFAHRGGAFHPGLEGLENTLAAFKHAVDLGYGYLETDVLATRDGVLLAFHDAVLDRVTGSTGTVSQMGYAEVADALIGGREQIPRLTDLFERFGSARFNIDIKSERAIEPLAELIRHRGLEDRVCVASFSEIRLRSFRRRAGPAVATSVGPASVVLTRLAPTAALARRLTRSPGVALQIPHRRGSFTVITPELLRRAHDAGRHVHVWTVDDPEEMHHLLDLGVDGVMTDRTDVLRNVLIDRGQWMGAPT